MILPPPLRDSRPDHQPVAGGEGVTVRWPRLRRGRCDDVSCVRIDDYQGEHRP
ncbi:hypothetical protein ACRAWD_03565 [Caulobacter segnis]